MPGVLLPGQVAAAVHDAEQVARQQQAQAERAVLLRAQAAATIMASLMQEEYSRTLDREEDLYAQALREAKLAKNHGRRVNGVPQRQILPVDIGRPAVVAAQAATHLLGALGVIDVQQAEQPEQQAAAENQTS